MNAPENLTPEEAIEWLLNQAWRIRLADVPLALSCAHEAKAIAERTQNAFGLARSIAFVAYFTFSQTRISEAIPMINEALDLLDSIGNEREKAMAYVLRGGCYILMGDYDQAFEDILLGVELGHTHDYPQAVAVGGYTLGNYHLESGNYELAYQHYEEILPMFERIKDMAGMATVVAGLGNIATATEQYELALEYHYKSLGISREIGNPQVEARNLHDLGVVYEHLEAYPKALEYLNQSLAIRKQKHILQGIISCNISLGRVYGAMNWYDLAVEKLQEAIELSQQAGALPKLVRAYKALADVHKKNQQPWEALQAMERYIELKSTVAGEETNAKLKAVQASHTAEAERHEAEIYKLKNIELKKAYELIEEQNEQMLESIRYAKRIQEALLPPPQERYADRSFIFYKPKDIVSGDFYWYAEVGEQTIVAAVDCTGHGVPGAFMVVLAISMLDEIVNEQGILQPTEILTRLDQKIRLALKQDHAEGAQDGMDLAVANICRRTDMLSFAGARSSLFQVRAGEIAELKGSMFPVGSAQYVGEKVYPQSEIQMQSGDVFYMATDGFRDQFGGEGNKKYTKPKFRELLRTISNLPIDEQKAALEGEFDAWRRDYPQTDDVLVMGFKR